MILCRECIESDIKMDIKMIRFKKYVGITTDEIYEYDVLRLCLK